MYHYFSRILILHVCLFGVMGMGRVIMQIIGWFILKIDYLYLWSPRSLTHSHCPRMVPKKIARINLDVYSPIDIFILIGFDPSQHI